MKGDKKMAGTIKITPEELRTASEFLGAKLEAMTSEARELKGRIDEITANWEGASQSAFVTGFTTDVWPVLDKTLPDVVNGIQKQLTVTAQTMEDTDTAIADKLRS